MLKHYTKTTTLNETLLSSVVPKNTLPIACDVPMRQMHNKRPKRLSCCLPTYLVAAPATRHPPDPVGLNMRVTRNTINLKPCRPRPAQKPSVLKPCGPHQSTRPAQKPRSKSTCSGGLEPSVPTFRGEATQQYYLCSAIIGSLNWPTQASLASSFIARFLARRPVCRGPRLSATPGVPGGWVHLARAVKVGAALSVNANPAN